MNLMLRYIFWVLGLVLFVEQHTIAQSDEAEKLESLLKLSKNDTSRVNILNALFNQYFKETPLKAKLYSEEALKISEKNAYSKGITESADNLGSVYHSQGGYAKAVEYYQKALKIKLNLKDRRGIAESYNKLGNTYILQEDIEKAVETYKKALTIQKELNDMKGVSTVLTNLGGVYYRNTDYAQAVIYHKEALNLADSLKDRQLLAYNFNRLGEAYFRQKNYKEALKCFRQQLHLGQRIGNKNEIQKAYQGLSQVHAEMDDFRKAYEYYQFYSIVKESLFREEQSESDKKFDDVATKLAFERQKLELAKSEKARTNLFIYSVLAATALILVITVILFRNNRQKQRINRLLEKQKSEIEKSNSILEEQKQKIEIQNESINRKNETLETTFQEIERKNKDITASITYAKRIQEAMLARDGSISNALPEHFIFWRPRDIVSGDFYWYAEKNGKMFLVALDCTGHGVPGAFMAMLGDSYLNQIVKLQGKEDPIEILNLLDESIGIALNQEATKNQDGMDVALCVIDLPNKKFSYTGASRPLLVIREGNMQVLESCKLPIGGFQRDRERIFERFDFDLNIPTTFYVFSDGFQDQFGGPKGRKFSKKRVEDLLFEIHHLPMKEQEQIIQKTLDDWMGQNRQMDDILMIGVKL